MKEVTDKNFEQEILNSEVPVLIEFWASWCVPCKTMEYLLKELDKEYDGKIKIAKLNIDRQRKTPKKYILTGVPTFITFSEGNLKEMVVGAQTKKKLILMIEKLLK
ncbi:MAG: thioredoxin [Promethearchaeota archaeon]